MSVYDTRLSKIIADVVESCKLKKWHYVACSETFENYFGDLVPVTVYGEDKEIVLKIIAKFAPLNHELRDCGVVHHLYCKEIYAYLILKSDFEKLLSNVDVSQIMPKCYFASDTTYEEVMILKDMRFEGYRRYGNELFMDVDHVKLSLETLAKFHALSVTLQEGNKKIFESHRETLKPFAIDDNSKYTLFIKNSMKKLMLLFEGTKYQTNISILDEKFDDGLVNEEIKANRMVYGHGDFWKENILFKYEEGKPKQACLVDYQLTRLMNPGYDVLFFILNATNGSIRRKHFNEFLSSYYNTLQQTLKENDLNCYTEKEFQEDLKSIASVCFAFVQSSFSLWLGLEKDTVLISKHLCSSEEEKEAKQNFYKRIIMDIIDDLQYFELI